MSKRRACCVNGERHKIRKMRRYAYKSSPQVGVHSGGRSEAITYRVLRLPRQVPLPSWFDEDWDEHEWLELLQREAQEVPGQLEIDYPPPPPPEDLVEEWESTLADDMVRRLNAWMPVHRDKWLGLGAVVLLAAAFTEAVMAVVTGIHVHW